MSDQTEGSLTAGSGQAMTPEIDTRHAHPARIYNYWLGGKDNYVADREAAEQAIAANPGIVTDVRANRAFLASSSRAWSSRSSGGPSPECPARHR